MPFALYPSNDSHGKAYTEAEAKNSGLFVEQGHKLIERFFER